jgi:hypothetical protein
VFKSRTPPEAIALCSSLLEYTPSSRLSPLEACAHSFFDELRCLGTQLPNNRPLPPLFNFSPGGESIAWDLWSFQGSQSLVWGAEVEKGRPRAQEDTLREVP